MSPGLLDAITGALLKAGATVEIVAAAVGAYEGWESVQRLIGRPRKYADTAARRRVQRAKKASPVGTGGGPDETPARPRYAGEPDRCNLRVRLIDASHGNADPAADISPIRALLDQGCDLDLDVLPLVAREIPDLPRPLKNWGAPWLVQDILAARDLRRGAPGYETKEVQACLAVARLPALLRRHGGRSLRCPMACSTRSRWL
jgi:hypothetical protein